MNFKFAFSSFWNLKAIKIPYFCQKMCLSRFLPSGKLTKWVKFAFSSFWNFKDFKIPHFCQKRSEYISDISTKREAHKMSKVCLFKKKVQITVFGWVISSYKSHVLLSVSTFQNKIVMPTSLTLERTKFFLLFFETYPCKTKKNDIQKHEHFPTSIKTRIEKCEYTLMQKKSHFWKISPTSQRLRFPLTHHNRTRFFHFLPKKIDKFTILHRIVVFFFLKLFQNHHM